MIDLSMTLSSPDVTLSAGAGLLTVSVTNGSTRQERVVLGAYPVAADGTLAAASVPTWTTIDKPLRAIAGGATEQYVAAFDLTAAPPGTHRVKLIAYSADDAPEDYAEYGHIVRLAVPAADAPPATIEKPRMKWWMIAVAAGILLAIIGAVVVFLVADGGPVVQVPDVIGRLALDASAELDALGFEVHFSADAECVRPTDDFNCFVVRQSVDGGTESPTGSLVVLTTVWG